MNEDGALSFGTSIDTSGVDEGIQQIEDKFNGLGQGVETSTSKISEMLNNLPNPNIDVSAATQSLDTIKIAWEQMDNIADSNTTAIKELEAEYNKLGKLAADSYYKATSEGDKEYNSLKQKQQAIKSLIRERKNVLTELSKTATSLTEAETRLTKEKEATEKAANATVSLRTRLRELKIALVEMEASGQRGTAQYQALQAETAKLTDAWGDAREQANILANDQRGMQGLISGISGVTGAFMAGQGAISLFAGENEDLQKIMVKLQSLMTITIGLQQVQQTLNKDSAFSLVTLNGLKEWWNKLTGQSAVVQSEETVATTTDTTAKIENSVANTTNAATKDKNNISTTAGTAATETNTIATNAQTASTVAGTVATKAMSIAMKGLKYALVATGIGAIIVGLGLLVSWIMEAVDSMNEADKAFEEHEKILEEGRKKYAEASIGIQNYQQKIQSFNGTKAQEKQLVKELNQKYGSAMGYYSSLKKWKEILVKKGEAYCQMLLKEAEAQAILSKYTEAYINLQTVKDKAAAGEYDHWYNTALGDKISRKKAITEAETDMNKWLDMYKSTMGEAQSLKDDFDLNTHKSSKSGASFDPKKAALDQQKAIEDWKKSVLGFYKSANKELSDYVVSSMEEGQEKEINQVVLDTQRKKEAWNEQIRQLAEVRKNAYKEYYMAQKGATEVGWSQSKRGKMSTDDYTTELLQDPAIAEKNNAMIANIEEDGQKRQLAIRKQYTDALIDEFGTTEQKMEKLELDWLKKMATIPPEYLNEATKQMDAQFSALATEGFKKSINWDSVFGDLDNQSIQSIQYSLDKVKTYFEQSKDSMSTTEIKDFQEAISKMEDEIASRNPFTALHKSLKDIESSKTELTTALQEWTTAQNELTTAKNVYNDAIKVQQELEAQIKDGTLAKNDERYTIAIEKVSTAKLKLNQATDKCNTAEQRTLKARNGITSAYKNFANNLRSVNGVVQDLGGKAKNLASCFSKDVANGIGKSIDFLDDVMDATSTVISAIGDTGKAVAKGVESTVDATAQGATAAATAGATAIYTIEKASVILAVISAALQVATAIANLFNDDEEKQKEIESLQERIDQLQWELDNAEAYRLQNKVGSAIEKLKQIYSDVTNEVLKLHSITAQSANSWVRFFAKLKYSSEIYQKSIEKIADTYAALDYTADKALGAEKYKEARSQLENLAEQQILLQKQINAEGSKKDTDNSKIQDWNNQIQELAEEMVSIINNMMEDIIGASAADIASELGNAFLEACATGEDAMEAWGKKAQDIVKDVLKKMLIQQYLEQPIGDLFNKYKLKWFGSDGTFKGGIQNVIDSMGEFSNDLNTIGETFSQTWEILDSATKGLLTDSAERDGTSKGIATASQDSVDENNARLTTIQGHTYSIVQGVTDLNRTGNAVLEKLTGIEDNTSKTNEKLDNMNSQVKIIKDTVDDISLKGLKIKS